eukprot:2354275-Pleurochrysis_carterae.AAC.1
MRKRRTCGCGAHAGAARMWARRTLQSVRRTGGCSAHVCVRGRCRRACVSEALERMLGRRAYGCGAHADAMQLRGWARRHCTRGCGVDARVDAARM